VTEFQALKECAGQRIRGVRRGRFPHANQVKHDPGLALRGR
jgi:hypothetical protein